MNKAKIKKKWIKISLTSLALSGFYSIFIVLLRTPFFTSLFKEKSFFQTALIVHVDLSVLFWMVCFIMMHITNYSFSKFDSLVSILQNLILISLFLIFFAPFFGDSEPYMNNYIPILHNFLFILAIAIFAAVYFVINLIACNSRNDSVVAIGYLGLAVLCSFVISAFKLSKIAYPIDQYQYYEMLFWGGGHLIQFVYCSGLMVVFYRIFEDFSIEVTSKFIFWLNSILVLPVIAVQFFVAVDSNDYFSLFTEHMKIFGALAPLSLICIIFISMLLKRKSNIFRFFRIENSTKAIKNYTFLLSLILFGFGGVLALLIDSSNVKIPAHYHGSIVGISIAFMGYIYLEVSEYFSEVNYKYGVLQLVFYALGQLIHITALAYAGGYGALRKTPGVELSYNAKIAMAFMGAGGFIAIIAGLFFIFICCGSLYKNINKINSLKV